MRKSGTIVSYTVEELNAGLAGPDQSDWAAFDAMTEEELEASIDYEEEGYPIWEGAHKGSGFPRPKQELTMRYDGEIIDWFKAQGDHFELRMNAVLRNYVEDQKAKEKKG
jgi:uncharacterized protein (DUF4415 family)